MLWVASYMGFYGSENSRSPEFDPVASLCLVEIVYDNHQVRLRPKQSKTDTLFTGVSTYLGRTETDFHHVVAILAYIYSSALCSPQPLVCV
jgi:hypothetical protein